MTASQVVAAIATITGVAVTVQVIIVVVRRIQAVAAVRVTSVEEPNSTLHPTPHNP